MKYAIPVLLALSSNISYALQCPEGTALVPALPPYSNQSFCVMTEEARKPTILYNKRWNWISAADADNECHAALVQGDLPTNSLWQAIARLAEMINENWTGGIYNSGRLKKDLVVVSGGPVFTDLGGGHWEHVRGVYNGTITAGTMDALQSGGPQYTINSITGDNKFQFGPAASTGTYTPSSVIGTSTNTYSSKIMRGGDDEEQGVFGVAVNHNGEAASDVSFRCACPLASCGI